MAESESGCPPLGPVFDYSSSWTSVSQAALSAKTINGDYANIGNTGGIIEMDLSGNLRVEDPRRIDWTAPLRAPQGDNAPKSE